MIEILKEDVNKFYLDQEEYNEKLKSFYEQLSKNIEIQHS